MVGRAKGFYSPAPAKASVKASVPWATDAATSDRLRGHPDAATTQTPLPAETVGSEAADGVTLVPTARLRHLEQDHDELLALLQRHTKKQHPTSGTRGEFNATDRYPQPLSENKEAPTDPCSHNSMHELLGRSQQESSTPRLSRAQQRDQRQQELEAARREAVMLSLEQQAIAAEKKLVEAQLDAAERTKLLNAANAKIRDLSHSLAEAQEENAVLRAELSALRTSMESERRTVSKHIENNKALLAEVERLGSAWQNAVEQSQKLADELERLRQERPLQSVATTVAEFDSNSGLYRNLTDSGPSKPLLSPAKDDQVAVLAEPSQNTASEVFRSSRTLNQGVAARPTPRDDTAPATPTPLSSVQDDDPRLLERKPGAAATRHIVVQRAAPTVLVAPASDDREHCPPETEWRSRQLPISYLDSHLPWSRHDPTEQIH